MKRSRPDRVLIGLLCLIATATACGRRDDTPAAVGPVATKPRSIVIQVYRGDGFRLITRTSTWLDPIGYHPGTSTVRSGGLRQGIDLALRLWPDDRVALVDPDQARAMIEGGSVELVGSSAD